MNYPGAVRYPVFRPFHLGQLRAAALPPRGALLGPWLREGSLSLLHGSRGVGKTHVALAIAHAVATGTELFGWAAPAPRRVLFIDGEMTIDDLQRVARALPVSEHDANLALIANDDEADPVDLAHAPHRERLEPHLEGVALIVVDNLATLMQGGSENAADSWAPLERWALRQRRANRAILFVHNSGRLGQPRGTSRREDRMDTILGLRPAPGESGATGFEVHVEKHRGSLPAGAFPLRAWLSPEGWRCAKLEDGPRQEVVALSQSGHSVRAIASLLGMAASNVYRLQQAARRCGELPAVVPVSPVSAVSAVPNDG